MLYTPHTPVEQWHTGQSADSDLDDNFIRFFANHIIYSSEPESTNFITTSLDTNGIPENMMTMTQTVCLN
jgi:hypothetical protein